MPALQTLARDLVLAQVQVIHRDPRRTLPGNQTLNHLKHLALRVGFIDSVRTWPHSATHEREASQQKGNITGRQGPASPIPHGCVRFESGCPRRQKAGAVFQVLGEDLSQNDYGIGAASYFCCWK